MSRSGINEQPIGMLLDIGNQKKTSSAGRSRPLPAFAMKITIPHPVFRSELASNIGPSDQKGDSSLSKDVVTPPKAYIRNVTPMSLCMDVQPCNRITAF